MEHLSDDLHAMFSGFVEEVRKIYGSGFVPLHRPVFEGNERRFLTDCIDSNFVSSVGDRVIEFEREICRFVGTKYAVATVNGTAALQVCLKVAGVGDGDEVITQALTFIATCNATRHCGAQPVFVDVDLDTLGMSPEALRKFLSTFAEHRKDGVYNRETGRRIAACVPMHTFGLPCRIDEIAEICQEYAIPLVEDAAESLGSYVAREHTGTKGRLAAFSFNGNKIITTGGGGMIVTNDEEMAIRARHITTTAKKPHAWEFVHDEVGFNFRLPNINAALGCAQMERLPEMLEAKKNVTNHYAHALDVLGIGLVKPRIQTTANNWLNAVLLEDRVERDAFLEYTNSRDIMTRPVWQLMHKLRMFESCQHDELANSLWLEDRLVNIPSSVPDGALRSSVA